MALTDKQRAAIKSQLKKNIAKRAATQRTKISASEARTVSNKMNKRPGATKQSFTLKDNAVLSKSERNTLGATSKANAAKEKMIQKNRNFAKGTGKLAVKDRVGTKAEYKQLGKDIEMRKQLIARSKAARAAQAARAANPTPAKATTLTKAEKPMPAKKKTTSKPKVTKAQIKLVEKQLKALPKAPPMNKSDIRKFEKQIDSLAAKDKASRGTTLTKPKASTEAIKKRTKPNTNPKTSKPKVTEVKKLQTLEEAKAKAPTPKVPTPKEAPTASSKPAGKIASKVDAAKKAASSTKTGSTLKKAANTTAAKSIAGKASKIGSSKLVKVGGKLVKIGAVIGAGREVAQVFSGQAEKDFRRTQVLENRLAAAKGQKPKYKEIGSGWTKNLGASLKQDIGNAANILSVGMVGKTRKDRLAELKTMVAKAEKNKLTKPAVKPAAKPSASAPKPQIGSKPSATTGSNYRVNSGDTLSGIAQRAGVSLSQLRSANPGITDPRKIFRNTKVVIPKGGKVPTGGYTPTKKAK
jgi:LysM repeat protein